MRYDETWDEQVVLRDGSAAHVRLIRRGDAPILREAFEHLSEESRYRRFFTAKPALTDAELEYFTNVDGHNHLAIGCARRDADGVEHGLGVARFVRLRSDPSTADVAVTVIDEAHGLGVGTMLLRRLVEAAQERGVARLHFDVLATNDDMLDLLTQLAPRVERHIEAGVIAADLTLDDA